MKEFTVHRDTSVSPGCRGVAHIYPRFDVESVIGRLLGDGARVRVTVEVLDEGRGIEGTINPRHTRGAGYDCVCTAWRPELPARLPAQDG